MSHVFARRPFICGVLGIRDTAIDLQLLKLAPLVDELRLPNAACRIWISGKSRRSVRDNSSFLFETGRTTDRSWNEAANEGHTGVHFQGSSARIFASATGLATVYYRRVEEGVAFASSPVPLSDLGSLSTDWDAWIDILTLGYPIGGATPAKEVRLLEGGKSLLMDGRRVAVQPFRTFWTELPQQAASAKTILEAVESAVPRIWQERPVVTLSGGWDSRLLAAVTRRRSRRPVDAHTTSTDNGYELDLELSPPVADRLGIRQHITSHPDDFRRPESSFRQRVFYETWMHTWLEPMASRLRDERRLVIDGLAGDVLIKNLFVTDDCLAESNPHQRMEHVWRALVRAARLQQEGMWSQPVAKWLSERGRERFLAATHQYADHPAGPTLAVLNTRTARGINFSPRWMFGPECEVLTPFTQRQVVESALSVPLEEKTGGGFYRTVLGLGAPKVAELPSTNDPIRKTKRPRKQISALNLSYHADLIRGSPDAIRLLPDEMKSTLDTPEGLAAVEGIGQRIRTMKGASLLAEWQKEWGHHLKDIGSAPW